MIYPGFLEWYDGDEWAGNIGNITSYVKKSVITVETDFMATISRLAFILLPLIALIYVNFEMFMEYLTGSSLYSMILHNIFYIPSGLF